MHTYATLDQLSRTLDRNTAKALIIDIDTGRTLAHIASQAAAGSVKRTRNRVNARRAYDSVRKFFSRLAVTPEEARQIEDKLQRLKSELERLGESF